MPASVLHLSALVGSPLRDSAGERLGKVEDVIVRLGAGDSLPPVTGLKARIGGRELFVSSEQIAELEPAAIKLNTAKLNLAQFERRQGEVLLRSDVLGRDLIDVQTASIVKAQEVELACDEGRWRVAGIDPSFRARLHRLLPRSRRGEETPGNFIDWRQLEPFVGHVPTARLRLAHRRIARLHPAQIADLVEAASHEEGEEIMQAVGQDRELEADVFEELDEEHQVEFLRERSDDQVAAVLTKMESDEAADLLLELDQDRRQSVLDRLPAAQQRKIRRLLGFNPSTAGGLMSVDFLCVLERLTVTEALTAVRATELPDQAAADVYLKDADGRLSGVVSLPRLARAAAEQSLEQIADQRSPATLDADLPEIARVMTDYNLISLPVVDESGAMVGILTVDDILEAMLPADWRRRYGLARG